MWLCCTHMPKTWSVQYRLCMLGCKAHHSLWGLLMGLQIFKSCCTCKYVSACCSTCHTHRHMHTRTLIFIFFHLFVIRISYLITFINNTGLHISTVVITIFFLNVMSCINVAFFPQYTQSKKQEEEKLKQGYVSITLSPSVCASVCQSVCLDLFIYIYIFQSFSQKFDIFDKSISINNGASVQLCFGSNKHLTTHRKAILEQKKVCLTKWIVDDECHSLQISCLKLFYILQFTVAVVPLHHFCACAERSNHHLSVYHARGTKLQLQKQKRWSYMHSHHM